MAFVLGALLPFVWALLLSGTLTLPPGAPTGLRWHAHEMLFGFGWAVLFGFLLTASKNWVGVRGMHGGPLLIAVGLFLVERVTVLVAGGAPRGPVVFLLLNATGAYVIAYLVFTLVRYRARDTFPDNWVFVVALPVFLLAKNLTLDPTRHGLGTTLAIGLFRVAFVVMFERTIPQFMKNAMSQELPRRSWLDHGIKGLVLVAAFEAWLPSELAAALLGLAAALLLGRLLTWKPQVAFRSFGIGVMYVGYAGLAVHLALAALTRSGVAVGRGALGTHVFTFVCMGLVIPSMLIRIAQGHTGRKPLFMRTDRLALGLMGVGALLRLVATQLDAQHYNTYIAIASACWSACFIVIGLRVGPFLWKPRTDGKEH